MDQMIDIPVIVTLILDEYIIVYFYQILTAVNKLKIMSDVPHGN
jgi:hypothetical protein